MRGRQGYTLMEMLITVVVIGIIAAISIPGYNKTVRRSHWNATNDILQGIYAGEQVYWTTNDVYKTIGANWADIWVDDPNTGSGIPVTFAVAQNGLTGAAATFTATATYTPSGQTRTVNQLRVFGGTWAMP